MTASSASEAVDIVQRLRETRTPGAKFLCIGAASEIERLRAENTQLKLELRDRKLLSDGHRQSAEEHLRDRLNAEARAASAEAKLAERDTADFDLIDKYRNPKTGSFSFPGDVAKIIRHFEARLAVMDAALGEIERLLVNLQPHIPQVCTSGRSGFIDNYVEPAIRRAREARAIEEKG